MISELYTRYQEDRSEENREALFTAVHRTALQRLRDEDVAQTATLRVFERMHTYKPERPFEFWVRAVIARCHKTDIRQHARFRFGLPVHHVDYASEDQHETEDVSRVPIEELPETERSICLAILNGDSITEAGARLGLSRDATRKRLRKLKKDLPLLGPFYLREAFHK